MSIWILVLTLNGSGRAIHSIPNFKTKEACMAAGDAWLKLQKDYGNPTALCLEQKQ